MRGLKSAAVLASALMLSGCALFAPKVRPPAAPPSSPAEAPPVAQTTPPPPVGPSCDAPAFDAAAAANAASLTTSAWMFAEGTIEKPEGPGWELYVPAIARTLATPCGPASAGFAHALSDWQAQHALPADGVMSRDTAAKLKEAWQAGRAHLTRPCIELSRGATAQVPAELRFEPERERRLQAATLQAYLAMRAAAQSALPDLAAAPDFLAVASAWRDPAEDKASCTANPGPCNGTAKAATCSAHWSGRAIDLNLGFLPDSDPTDSTYANRLHQSKGAAYAWMLDNAARFGFVNYYYEPWHWEWQGDGAPR
jgi:LAS superfamily LD-carboxypeptidase LdcB